MLSHFIPEALGSRFWDCSLNVKHVDMFLAPITPIFWRDVIHEWFIFKEVQLPISEPLHVLNQVLWCNSNILVNQSPILFEHCVNRGLIYIRDLFDSTMQKLPLGIRQESFKITWWQYVTLWSAIPKDWLQKLPVEMDPTVALYDSLFDTIQGVAKPVSYVYNA